MRSTEIMEDMLEEKTYELVLKEKAILGEKAPLQAGGTAHAKEQRCVFGQLCSTWYICQYKGNGRQC